MTFFFYGPPTSDLSLRKGYEAVIKQLQLAGYDVITDIPGKPVRGSIDVRTGTSDLTFAQVDALVIDGSAPGPETGYFLASGLAGKKPVLYLYRAGSGGDRILELISRKPDPYTVVARSYRAQTLSREVDAFLQSVVHGGYRETPNIKFTLRITNSLERYLHYKTHNTKLTKADFLRELLEGLMTDDAEYHKYLRTRSRNEASRHSAKDD
jgi:hypothetical protein